MNRTLMKLMALGALASLILAPAVGAAGFGRALTKREMGLRQSPTSEVHARRESGSLLTTDRSSALEGTQLLPNGDFEQGQTVWTEFSQNGFDIIMNSGFPAPVLPHSGAWLAWLGGAFDEISHIEQEVMVPAGTSNLTYWEWIDSEDLCDFDFATVFVDGSTVEEYSLCEDSSTLDWVLHEIDISSFAGQTVTIRIRVETDDTWLSNLFVDDVSFEVAGSFFADGFESGDTSAWSDSSP